MTQAVEKRAVRQCRFAGHFFPSDPQELSAQIDGFLHKSARDLPNPGAAVGIVSPHAGYRFSGQLAAHAFHSASMGNYQRIIILSPSHRHAFSGLAIPSQEAYLTPLGKMNIDQHLCGRLVNTGLVQVLDAAHNQEHGIETQLPFIQKLWPNAQIVPIVVGKAERMDIVRVLKMLQQTIGAKTYLTVISSDLSHLLEDSAACKLDAKTAQLIETFSSQGLTAKNACGWSPLSAWLEFAQLHNYMPLRLGQHNSSKTGSSADRVVGYGAWKFLHKDQPRISLSSQKNCLQFARRVLAYRLDKGAAPKLNRDKASPLLNTHMASFVTLNEGDKLRGCIGTCLPHRPLVDDICHNTIAAGFSDPRFKPLAPHELENLTIKIAVLSVPAPMEFSDEADLVKQLRPGTDGLILTDGRHRGVFLPAVWEKLKQPTDFLNNLKAKAGLDRSHWSDTLKMERFTVESFGES